MPADLTSGISRRFIQFSNQAGFVVEEMALPVVVATLTAELRGVNTPDSSRVHLCVHPGVFIERDEYICAEQRLKPDNKRLEAFVNG